MRLFRVGALLALLSSAGCAYHNPTEASVPPVDPTMPSQVTLGVSPGSGADGGTATVTARVQNANGAALPNVIVTFTTTRGTVSPAQVTTGSSGAASAKLTASDTADVTAIAGTVSAHTMVIATPGTPTPTPTLPLSFLNVSGSATVGAPVTFGVSSSVVGATWIWSFGDGATEQGTAFTTTHIYNHAGIYTASVSSTSAAASNATITVSDAPPPTTPAPGTGTGLSAVLTCTPGTHGSATTKTACNVTLTDGGTPIGGGTVTRVEWDWGDGSVVDNVTTVPVNAHMYANPGSYTVFATVTATPVDVSKTTKTSQTVVVP